MRSAMPYYLDAESVRGQWAEWWSVCHDLARYFEELCSVPARSIHRSCFTCQTGDSYVDAK